MIKQSYTTVSYLRPLGLCYGELPHRLSSWSGCWSSRSDPDRGERSLLSPAASSSWGTIWIWSCKEINVKSFFFTLKLVSVALVTWILIRAINNQLPPSMFFTLSTYYVFALHFAFKIIHQHQVIMNQLNFKLTDLLNFLKILWTMNIHEYGTCML